MNIENIMHCINCVIAERTTKTQEEVQQMLEHQVTCKKAYINDLIKDLATGGYMENCKTSRDVLHKLKMLAVLIASNAEDLEELDEMLKFNKLELDVLKCKEEEDGFYVCEHNRLIKLYK